MFEAALTSSAISRLNHRVREIGRLFEVLQVDVVKYEEKGFDVIVGISMQELDWEQRNIQIVMGRGCWSW